MLPDPEKFSDGKLLPQYGRGCGVCKPAPQVQVSDPLRRPIWESQMKSGKYLQKRCGQKASLFSFNGAGKCPACKGKGVIVSDMAFMDDIETTCDV